MAETAKPEENPAAAAFSAHVQAFYDGLPSEEKTLLEQVFALAASAAGDQGDTQGFSMTPLFGMAVQTKVISNN